MVLLEIWKNLKGKESMFNATGPESRKAKQGDPQNSMNNARLKPEITSPMVSRLSEMHNDAREQQKAFCLFGLFSPFSNSPVLIRSFQAFP